MDEAEIHALVAAGVTAEQLAAAFIAHLRKLAAADAATQAEHRRRAADKKRRQRDVSVLAWRALRISVFERDGYVCTYCGADVRAAPQCDHIIPRAKGGLSLPENLTTACGPCNSSKGASESPKGTQ